MFMEHKSDEEDKADDDEHENKKHHEEDEETVYGDSSPKHGFKPKLQGVPFL